MSNTGWVEITSKGDRLVLDALRRLEKCGVALRYIEREVPVNVRPKVFHLGGKMAWPHVYNNRVDWTVCQERLVLSQRVYTRIVQECKTPRDYTCAVHRITRAINWCEKRIEGLERAKAHILAAQTDAVDEIEARVGLHALEEI